MEEDVGQFGAKRLGVLGGGEVAVVLSPVGDGVGDAADELFGAALAAWGAQRAAEVFGDDDVGRQLRPERGDLDVLLLKDDVALLVANGRRAQLPRHFVEGIDARASPATGNLQPSLGGLMCLAPFLLARESCVLQRPCRRLHRIRHHEPLLTKAQDIEPYLPKPPSPWGCPPTTVAYL